VAEAAVIGLPDPRWIEAVHAVVTLRPGVSVPAAEIIAHCRAGLPRHKVPKQVHFSEGIPRTAVGKLDKRLLRTRYTDAAARN
jgi:fatty-acyl-CoA synthase